MKKLLNILIYCVYIFSCFRWRWRWLLSVALDLEIQEVHSYNYHYGCTKKKIGIIYVLTHNKDYLTLYTLSDVAS